MRVEDFPMALRMLRTNPRSQEELARLYLAEFAKYQALAAVTSRLSRELAFDPGDFNTLEKQYKVARSAELAQLRKYSDIFGLLTQETKDKYLRARVSARVRDNPVGKFTVYHGDHGITPEQKEWIKGVLYKEAPQGFFIIQVNIPAELGTVKNALYGPAAGDAPVPESQVSYRPRGDRPWADRVIDLPTRQIGYVQTIGQRTGDDFELWTIFGGPNAPRNPGDPQNPDPEGSRKWWSQHALSLEQWS